MDATFRRHHKECISVKQARLWQGLTSDRFSRNFVAMKARLIAVFPIALATCIANANPLQEPWNTPFETPPFDRIEAAHFEPAFEWAMERHRGEIATITSSTDAPNFENTITALEKAGTDLSRVQRTFSALTSSATSDDLRAIESRMSPKLAAHGAAIKLDAKLFARVDALFEDREALGLDAEQARVLERTHTGFVRAGAQLKGENRERLAKITEELAGLSTAFSQNVLKSAEAFALVLESDEDQAGLPEFVLSAAAQAGVDRGKEGKHVITLARSSFEPFMTFSTRRDLREALFQGWTNRGDNDDEFDNEANIRKILQLRLEFANLLGFDDYSAYRTANTMAGSASSAKNCLLYTSPSPRD